MSPGIAVLRVRGRAHMKPQVEYAMRLIGLTRKNYCTILPEGDQTKRTIFKVKDYTTWGTVDDKMVEALLRERGRVSGDKKLTDQYVKANSKFADLKALAASVAKGEARLKDVEGLKKFFRLNPPKKGFERKGIKKPFNVGGALGDRKDKIGDLLGRMI
jgi:large subunit ribosomal protein L30